MGRKVNSIGAGRAIPVALAAAGLAFAIPGAGLAVGTGGSAIEAADIVSLPFTPANIDPQLARQVAAIIGEDGLRAVRPPRRRL